MAVKFQEKTGKWEARIRFLGEDYQIGTFDTQEKARAEYDRVNKAAERIKSEEEASKKYPLQNNEFAMAAYERGQGIKKVCISCCGGSIQNVRQCDFTDCENFKFRPV